MNQIYRCYRSQPKLLTDLVRCQVVFETLDDMSKLMKVSGLMAYPIDIAWLHYTVWHYSLIFIVFMCLPLVVACIFFLALLCNAISNSNWTRLTKQEFCKLREYVFIYVFCDVFEPSCLVFRLGIVLTRALTPNQLPGDEPRSFSSLWRECHLSDFV